MKKILLLLTMMAMSTIGRAQVAIDFEPGGSGTDFNWNVFENTETAGSFLVVDNPSPTGGNTSTKVAQFIARQGGQTWAGVRGDGITPFIFDETNRIMKVWVWKSVISDVGIKLETTSNWSQGELKVSNTKTGEWEELTFDFTGRENPPAGEAFTGVSFFPDFREGRTADETVFFDNFSYAAANTDVVVEGGGGDVQSFCGTEVTHLGIPAESASAIFLTVANESSNQMKVTIESANEDAVDLLILNSFSGDITGSPAQSPEDKSEEGKISIVLTWAANPPAEVEFNILWSKVSTEGNWMLNDKNSKVAFNATCDGSAPTAPTTAAPTPTHAESDVIALFSDSYTVLQGIDYNPGWGQKTVYSTMEIEGNSTIKLAGLDYQGLALAGNTDVSGMTYLHLDYWTANSSDFSVFLISPGDPAKENAVAMTVPSTEWKSMDIPLTEYTVPVLTEIFQLKFAGNGDIYMDNLYFHKGAAVSVEDQDVIPSNFTLEQNYPNPFNPSTKISFSTKNAAQVTLEVYNVMGQKLATLVNGFVSSGNHTATFDATNFASGMYLYKLTAGNFSSVKSMMLIK